MRFEGLVMGRNEKGCIQQGGGDGRENGWVVAIHQYSPLISAPGETQGLFATRRVKKIMGAAFSAHSHGRSRLARGLLR